MWRARPFRTLAGPLGVPPLLAALALLALALFAPSARADDANLVKQGQKGPYVFIMLDVSGSMNQSVNCSQAQFDAGQCSIVCPQGDCLPHSIGDDPGSKIRTAKEAIYEIMRSTDNINFGFGTYDQGQIRALRKHWWYALQATQPAGFITLDSGRQYPAPGQQEIFGEASFYCSEALDASNNTQVASLRYIGCPIVAPYVNPTTGTLTPARLSDPWESERVRHWPKLGLLRGGATGDALTGNTYTRYYYIKDTDNKIYKVTFQPKNYPTDVANGLGLPLVTATIKVEKCNNATTCNAPIALTGGTKDLVWVKQSEMIYWESGEGFSASNATTSPPPVPVEAFYGAGTGVRNYGSGNALSLDPNTDTSGNVTGPPAGNQDSFTTSGTTINLRQDTVTDPLGRGAAMSIGDIIPPDWKDNQRARIMTRMAPNTIITPTATPDFGIATYFKDFVVGSETALRLKDNRARPLVPDGGTPIGGSLNGFKSWLTSWYAVASNATTGDPNFACRQMFVLFITDGLASSNDTPDACQMAEDLRKLTIGGKPYPVRTYMVALGLPGNTLTGYNNTVSCVPWRGGTGKSPATNNCSSTNTDPSANTCEDIDGDGKDDGPGPLFPQNKTELVQALTNILQLINTESRSFAAAAVPSVQANILDKVVLSSFVPVNEVIWPGRIDAYIKPIPFKTIQITLADGTTEDRSVPNRDLVCTSPTQIGCRVWDGGEQLLLQAATASEVSSGDFNLDNSGGGEDKRRVYFLYQGLLGTSKERRFFKIPTDTASWTDMLAGMKVCALTDVVCNALTANRTAATNAINFTHRVKQYDDPNQIGHTIDYILGDIFHSDPTVVGQPKDFRYFSADLNGYRAFFAKHRYRRQMLLVGSNDGELHAFDAGVFRGSANGAGVVSGDFDNGSGRELFAYIPRPVLPALKKASDDDAAGKTDQRTYKVDGAVAIGDVFINPLYPTTGAKEWRTVAIGGLREGGGTFSVAGRTPYSGYYALDITQPDELDSHNIPQPQGSSVRYVPSCALGSATCGPLPFPGVLWEFTDPCTLGPCDEEASGIGKGTPDLGDTWSTPIIGRIKICTSTVTPTTPCPGANVQDRYVAIFGGGMDPARANATGNWLYMVDVETGKLLYKRQLNGSVPSKPAAVDTDLDGYIDTIYIGTVTGFLYKVDVSSAQPLTTIAIGDQRVTAAAWNPFVIFNTEGRPIYDPPAVIFVTQKGRFALGFGTGDREDLWASTTLTGRYFMILDDNFQGPSSSTPTAGLPFTAANYRALTVSSSSVAGADFLVNNTSTTLKNGWYLELDVTERVITETFALSGVTVFSAFKPTTTTGASGSTTICGFSGTSRIFAVNTVNGNALASFNSGLRYRTVHDFVTSPFTERGQTKNDPNGPGGAGAGTTTTDELTDALKQVMLELQKLFPSSCRFANYTINIKAVRSDTGLEFIAPVPVCLIEKNWKEF